MRWALVVLWLVAACGSRRTTTEGADTGTQARRADCKLAATGCHSAEECHGRGICEAAAPTSDPGCGIPPRHTEDCKAGDVCNSFFFACETGHRCEARCDTAGCPDGSLCRADGRCSARRCPDEWSCEDYGECRPPGPGEGPLQGGRDWHGCIPQTCTTDADCPCANCVSRHCSLLPGRCIEARG